MTLGIKFVNSLDVTIVEDVVFFGSHDLNTYIYTKHNKNREYRSIYLSKRNVEYIGDIDCLPKEKEEENFYTGEKKEEDNLK